MQASNLPTKVPLPFANAGTKNTIPLASQIGITPGAASLTDGFPPLTFTPLASGGVPPAGADFNGILNLITGVQQWQSAGGIFKYDSAFSTSVGGYPKGAILESSDGSTLWLNLADNNTADPDGATPTNWVPLASYGISAVTGLTNVNVTLTSAQYSKSIITLAGTLTGNVQIIFPATASEWLVVNNTTGAFAVTCKTSAGTGISVPQGGKACLWGDGTNINQAAITQEQADLRYITQATGDARYAALAGLATQLFSVAAATSNNHAVNLGQFVASFGTSGYFKLPGGLILQWGTGTTSGGTASVTFPLQFLNACYGAFPVWYVSGSQTLYSLQSAGLTTTGFSIASTGGYAYPFLYLAIGH